MGNNTVTQYMYNLVYIMQWFTVRQWYHNGDTDILYVINSLRPSDAYMRQ